MTIGTLDHAADRVPRASARTVDSARAECAGEPCPAAQMTTYVSRSA
jgi:hypothetical protein